MLMGVVLVVTALLLSNLTPALAGIEEPTAPPEEVYPTVTPGGPTLTPSSEISPRQEKPIVPDNPDMADRGSLTWWGVCMACHGDKGQGLTLEWRITAFGEDFNCWQSKCHAANHPPQGFVFPKEVPPAMGEGTLRRFVTAAELQRYLKTRMPWWAQGSLSQEQAWELTAFLLRQDGYLERGKDLDIEHAELLPVHLSVRDIDGERTWQWVLVGVLSLAIFGMVGTKMYLNLHPVVEIKTPAARSSFFYHLHPPTIPVLQARWRYTLGAGGVALFLFLLLGLTGILEMFFYIPTPEMAGLSIQEITFSVSFGNLVRSVHFWAAQALVVVVMIHLLRVVLTGAFVQPRRFNYLLGLGLLLIVLFLDFTGYVLRWDEGIRWALMVGTNLLKTIPLVGKGLHDFVVGGESPGAVTLNRFYAWHILGLALIGTLLIGWHIFRVRRDGGISAPPPDLRKNHNRIPRHELLRREVLAMLVTGVLLVLVSAVFRPPLAPPISDPPLELVESVRAPWFFLWIQQLLRHGNAFWMGVGVPLGALGLLISLPYLFRFIPAEQRGRWLPKAGREAQLLAIAIVLGWLVLTALELIEK